MVQLNQQALQFPGNGACYEQQRRKPIHRLINAALFKEWEAAKKRRKAMEKTNLEYQKNTILERKEYKEYKEAGSEYKNRSSEFRNKCREYINQLTNIST